jgi:hypothetical protein
LLTGCRGRLRPRPLEPAETDGRGNWGSPRLHRCEAAAFELPPGWRAARLANQGVGLRVREIGGTEQVRGGGADLRDDRAAGKPEPGPVRLRGLGNQGQASASTAYTGVGVSHQHPPDVTVPVAPDHDVREVGQAELAVELGQRCHARAERPPHAGLGMIALRYRLLSELPARLPAAVVRRP